MTLFGWDASHFDGQLSLPILQRARGEGITFFTHKIGEGLNDTEGSLDDTALAAARDAGIPFVGGYLIPRSNATPAAQVARWVQLADAGEGWWRSFPGWFWQIDLERWSYDNVAASVGIECANRLRDATSRAVLLYASRGQYGDQLGGWAGPLWNADYRAGPGYPGDGWVAADKGAAAGWAPYSGRAPMVLQYTSSATIAGLSTCDKNAFRGTVADFAAMIGGTMADLTGVQAGELHNGAQLVYDLIRGEDPIEVNAADTGKPLPPLPNPFVALAAKLDALAAPSPVALTDDDRAAIIAGVIAGMPKPPTAAEVVTEFARRLAAGEITVG